jgi:PilZ domain
LHRFAGKFARDARDDRAVRAMHRSAMMSTNRLLLESGSAPPRSDDVRAHHLTDHDAGSLRQTVDLTATVRVSGAPLRAQKCRLRSLSLGGAFLERDWLPIGTLINITLHLPSLDDRLSFDAIVHGRARDGVSVLFDSLRASELWALWQYLTSLAYDAELETTKKLVLGG